MDGETLPTHGGRHGSSGSRDWDKLFKCGGIFRSLVNALGLKDSELVMANVHDVAAHLLKNYGSMSTMKLQKLCYYSQAWHLVWDEKPLFRSKIQAWMNGPVIRDLYNEHRGQFIVDSWPEGDASRLDDSERETIDLVWEAYGKYSGQQLSDLTHREKPWIVTRAGLDDSDRSEATISPELMQAYYSWLESTADSTEV